jgi:hypothetical protein
MATTSGDSLDLVHYGQSVSTVAAQGGPDTDQDGQTWPGRARRHFFGFVCLFMFVCFLFKLEFELCHLRYTSSPLCSGYWVLLFGQAMDCKSILCFLLLLG